MTLDDLRGRPTVPLWPVAGQALGVGRTRTFAMVRRGEWPTRVLRLGRQYRVPTADLLALLGADQEVTR